ncbi:hypothetical protein [Acinetobacter haemolyticus]|uniref:hypothetical protein n=1 Tax=Acinetobacter haemolyticus TaxID=29430 RepID=UPI003EF79083
MTTIIRFFIPILSILIGIIVFLFTAKEGYEFLFLHPFIYAVCFFIVLYKGFTFSVFRPFLFVFTLISTLRFMVLPLLIVLSNHYGGRSPVEPLIVSYQSAIFLMAWELIACTTLIIFLEIKARKYITDERRRFTFENKNFIYILFIIIAFLMLLINPKALLYINFIFPSVLDDTLEANFITNLTVYFFLIAKVLIVLMLVKFFYNKKYGYFIILFLILLNIMIYWGTNKSDILIAGIASALVFYQLYGRKSLKSLVILGVFLVFIISAVNSFRDTQKISEDNYLIGKADSMQVYTGGVYNVAIAIETKKYYPEVSNLNVLMFDIFRPMIGPNLLLKNQEQVYSNIYFNNRIWTHVDRRSQIIPMIGQANIFLGYLFAPFFSMFFLCLAYFLEKIYFCTRNIEVYYFLSLALIRLGFMFGQNTMNMINDLSMNIFLFYLLYVSNKIFNNFLRR